MLLTCDALSIEHVDGSTQCVDGDACDVPHELHAFFASCAMFDPPCSCSPDEAFSPEWQLAA